VLVFHNLHEEFYNARFTFCEESVKFRESVIGRSCSTHVRMRNVYSDLDRRLERKRPLGRHLCRWIKKNNFGELRFILFHPGYRAMMVM
jgi:hypothetical protein